MSPFLRTWLTMGSRTKPSVFDSGGSSSRAAHQNTRNLRSINARFASPLLVSVTVVRSTDVLRAPQHGFAPPGNELLEELFHGDDLVDTIDVLAAENESMVDIARH